MRYGFFHECRQLLGGQSLARIRMNAALAKKTIAGRTVDVGGGRHPDYFSYLQGKADSIEAVDGSLTGIDFENDPLPYPDQSVDTVLCMNVLEHIYHHAHLLREMKRILSAQGTLIGFVPFWVGYHPDPHDYFRYTPEALMRLLTDAGCNNIQITTVGGGPLVANFNTIVLSVPRFVRPLLYVPYALLDALMLKLRPSLRTRYPFGFLFTAHPVHA